MLPEPPALLSAEAAASMLGISRTTFWRRVQDGTFPSGVKIAGVTRWWRDDLLQSVRAHAARDEDKTRGAK